MINNKQIFRNVLLLLAVILFYSCTKEELKSGKYYYGKISVALATLPGTSNVDIYCNNKLLGTIEATGAATSTFQISANEPGKISVYKSGTDSLIADTLINLPKNESGNYRLANSEELGIKGWISSKLVAQDSVSFQLINKLGTANYPVASPDLYICSIDENTLEVIDTLAIYPGFKNSSLTPAITLPVYNAAGNTIWYVGKLKDPVTGLFVMNIGLGMDLFPIFTSDFNKGSFSIVIVEDDIYSGYINVNPIQL